mmetsp:Transcript_14618/g.31850  ORF Transcript_14618/g.31850 Transcript_14618/m.31850 type:complete len:207 (+) Transcript_14618:172-792(+)
MSSISDSVVVIVTDISCVDHFLPFDSAITLLDLFNGFGNLLAINDLGDSLDGSASAPASTAHHLRTAATERLESPFSSKSIVEEVISPKKVIGIALFDTRALTVKPIVGSAKPPSEKIVVIVEKVCEWIPPPKELFENVFSSREAHFGSTLSKAVVKERVVESVEVAAAELGEVGVVVVAGLLEVGLLHVGTFMPKLIIQFAFLWI